MRRKVKDARYLVAEFFSNIGVAWFTSGVIGIIIGQKHGLYEIIFSIMWGLLFSFIFLSVGVKLINK